MGRPPLATKEDLERELGGTVPETAVPVLERASEIVRAYATVDWLNDDETALQGVPGQIPGVVVGMVERATRNPEGVVAETAGPYVRSFGPAAASKLYMTKWEMLVVRGVVGTASGIGTISTTRGDLETAPVAGPTRSLPEETLKGVHDLLGGS